MSIDTEDGYKYDKMEGFDESIQEYFDAGVEPVYLDEVKEMEMNIRRQWLPFVWPEKRQEIIDFILQQQNEVGSPKEPDPKKPKNEDSKFFESQENSLKAFLDNALEKLNGKGKRRAKEQLMKGDENREDMDALVEYDPDL